MDDFTPNLLKQFCSNQGYEILEAVVSQRVKALSRPHWEPVRNRLAQLQGLIELSSQAAKTSEEHGAVYFKSRSENTEKEIEIVRETIEALIPWRKGPWNIAGVEIDSEWRSEKKWERLEGVLGELSGRRVLDVGCGNGYYMYRAALAGAECVLGLDPSELFYYQCQLFSLYSELKNLQYLMLGVEDLAAFEANFDIVLCMGVLYHQRSPLDALRLLAAPLKRNGKLVLETQVLPGDGYTVLSPPSRYAKARNVYFVPTVDSLLAWLKRSGYSNVELHSVVSIDFEEQRSTRLAPYESLADFLDPSNPELTIEGFPAPLRAIVTASKRNS